MDSHPVPQNVIEVEFKLFGAFTLKQFMKIVFGCLFALFIYLFPLPFYIKFPLMAIAVILGIGMAIVPNLGVWLNGFIKSLFISPRYVWIKEKVTPEMLVVKPKTSLHKDIKVEKQQKEHPEISEISLEKLLSSSESITKAASEAEEEKTPEDIKLEKILNEIYAKQNKKHNITKSTAVTTIKNNHNTSSAGTPVKKREKTKEDYLHEINKLKSELSQLVKDQHYKEKESEIMNKINDLYQEMKFASMNEEPKEKKAVTGSISKTEVVTDAKGQVIGSYGQSIFGIVVDRADNPVPGAVIKLDNPQNDVDFAIKSGADGRFMLGEKLPFGTYNITIEHPNFKFHTYKIVVGQSKLPAYKLRAK